MVATIQFKSADSLTSGHRMSCLGSTDLIQVSSERAVFSIRLCVIQPWLYRGT